MPIQGLWKNFAKKNLAHINKLWVLNHRAHFVWIGAQIEKIAIFVSHYAFCSIRRIYMTTGNWGYITTANTIPVYLYIYRKYMSLLCTTTLKYICAPWDNMITSNTNHSNHKAYIPTTNFCYNKTHIIQLFACKKINGTASDLETVVSTRSLWCTKGRTNITVT